MADDGGWKRAKGPEVGDRMTESKGQEIGIRKEERGKGGGRKFPVRLWGLTTVTNYNNNR